MDVFSVLSVARIASIAWVSRFIVVAIRLESGCGRRRMAGVRTDRRVARFVAFFAITARYRALARAAIGHTQSQA